FGCGLVELRATIGAQPRRTMSEELWARFTGLAAARAAIGEAVARAPGGVRTAAIVDEGKQAHIIRRVLGEMGIEELAWATGGAGHPDAIVIGTLSPGPMLDACARRLARQRPGGPMVIAPWRLADERRAAPLALAPVESHA